MVGKTLRLKEKHGWKCKPGYCAFVLDRGAVRFDISEGWIMKFGESSVRLHDVEPPDDNAVLEISRFLLPPVDWSGLPIRKVLAESVPDNDPQVLERKDIVEVPRADLELAWLEKRYIDSKDQREASSCTAMGRGSNVACLITFDFWADQAVRFRPVWDEVLRSLVLGLYVEDPTRGPLTQ